jgi:hypothetical protein
MPPRPREDRIWYLPAKNSSLFGEVLGVMIVSVKDEGFSCNPKEVPQVLQNLESSVFKFLHSGHKTSMCIPINKVT